LSEPERLRVRTTVYCAALADDPAAVRRAFDKLGDTTRASRQTWWHNLAKQTDNPYALIIATLTHPTATQQTATQEEQTRLEQARTKARDREQHWERLRGDNRRLAAVVIDPLVAAATGVAVFAIAVRIGGSPTTKASVQALSALSGARTCAIFALVALIVRILGSRRVLPPKAQRLMLIVAAIFALPPCAYAARAPGALFTSGFFAVIVYALLRAVAPR
jgi:hypothetical protein